VYSLWFLKFTWKVIDFRSNLTIIKFLLLIIVNF